MSKDLAALEAQIRAGADKEGVPVEGALLVFSTTSNPDAKQQHLIFWVLWPDRLEIHDVGGDGIFSSKKRARHTIQAADIKSVSVVKADLPSVRLDSNGLRRQVLFSFPEVVKLLANKLKELQTTGSVSM